MVARRMPRPGHPSSRTWAGARARWASSPACPSGGRIARTCSSLSSGWQGTPWSGVATATPRAPWTCTSRQTSVSSEWRECSASARRWSWRCGLRGPATWSSGGWPFWKRARRASRKPWLSWYASSKILGFTSPAASCNQPRFCASFALSGATWRRQPRCSAIPSSGDGSRASKADWPRGRWRRQRVAVGGRSSSSGTVVMTSSGRTAWVCPCSCSGGLSSTRPGSSASSARS
mmetsp:Transcript_73676/g.239924  ORF Transcript_73676/g.239924 Transcript_73676/m.239924 type:complete len:233 (-) Transcript_73676:632-1330(-)